MGGLYPSIVSSGNKIYELRLKKAGSIVDTSFRDSYFLMPCALSELVKAYGLKIQDK
ncbi:hypothetical protein AAVH_41482, partial [Aphelenchoides avenae]